MPSKTQAESILEIRIELAAITERVRLFKSDVDQADLRVIRGRLAVVESQVADVRKHEDENDRRRWQFWLGVGVVVLTFVANLTVQLLMFFARKPG